MKIEKINDLKNVQAVQIKTQVFVVHGHNEVIREKVARLISTLGYKPIILHERPNKGRTIIEKFEINSDVAYAVVLLTGDDKGGKAEDRHDNYNLRARQNVILELGFFLGRLGREKVCALYEDGVEIPSDYQGVVFTPIDQHDHWKTILAKEMKAAGLAIDLNKI